MANKPTLVLLSGWGMPPSIWDGIRPVLSERFQVLAPDWQAYMPATDPLLPEDWLNGTARHILSSVGTPAVWLGWSLGGALVTAMANLAPERVSQRLYVAHHPRFVASHGDIGMSAEALAAFRSAFDAEPEAAWRRFSALQCQGAPHARQDLRVVQELVGTRPVYSPTILARGLDLLAGLDQTGTFPGAPPYACLWGAADRIAPPPAARACDTVLPDAAHVPFISHPSGFIAWLDTVCRRTA